MTGAKLEAEINAVADAVETQVNGFVGSMFQGMYEHLEPKLQKGLDDVIINIWKVFAQTGDSPQSYALAHAAVSHHRQEKLLILKMQRMH
ncbi:MAG: hypothetical protein CM15mV2_0780 [uncultured marine virus]|nr:MAG: hypothetical protein CM15mV2_0780 [uncultured marine virus]